MLEYCEGGVLAKMPTHGGDCGGERTPQRQPYPRMRTALRHPRQPLCLHLIEHRLLLLLVGVVPEQPSLEGGPRAAEAAGTIAVAQMGSEGSMALTQR